MTRVQVYLDQDHLNILDWMAIQSGVSRSQALRQTISTVGKKVTKKAKKKNPLLQMIGFAKNAPARLSQNIDEIYTRAYYERKNLH